jgi:hypothetical protein
MQLTAIKQYLPSLGLVLVTVLGAAYTAMQDNKIDASEFFMLATAFCTAVTTYIVPRATGAKWLKPAVAFVGAALTTAGAAFITDGINAQEWVLIALQALGALGVAGTNGQVPLSPSAAPAPARAQASG